MGRSRLAIPIVLAAAVLAGTAQGREAGDASPDPADALARSALAKSALARSALERAVLARAPATGGLDLTAPRGLAASLVRRDGAALPPGVARTSVDRRLASDEVTGSLGFLCGLGPGFHDNAPTGSDPHGRFLGAKLSVALR